MFDEIDDDSYDFDIIYEKQVVDFVTTANEFCNFIEQSDSFELQEFMEKVQKILSFLYLKSLLLPTVKPQSNSNIERFVAQHDWEFIKHTIARKLGSRDLFVDVVDDIENESDVPMSLSLSECFADIYQDIKDFVTLYRLSGEAAIYEGLWECRNNFEHRWGQRLLGVLQTFHSILYGTGLIEEETYFDDDNQ